MLERSFGLFYYLKQVKKQKNDERYVYLRITVNGIRKDVSVKRQWESQRWNSQFGRAIGIKKDAKELNAYLDVLLTKIYQIKRELIDSGKPVTANSIKNRLIGKDHDNHMILAEFRNHNTQMQALVGKEFAPSTLCRYKTAHDHTKNFIMWKYEEDDMNIKRLDYEFISQFAFWLKSERKCGHNVTLKYLGNLRKIVVECLKKEWLTNDPFANFKFSRIEKAPIALTKQELIRIVNKRFNIERLNHVKDIFLFCCYTGLAYIDVCQLRRLDITYGVDDRKWITTVRKKTGSAIRLPLLPLALEIMIKYDKDPICIERGFLLPVLSNQKMNSYLKEIADACNIRKNLTFHIARHTFATTITLSNGVPIETVSKMLGHKSVKQTQHYAKIVDIKISQDMQELCKKLKMSL
ncbi:MAG: site-specific integrase [Bacteroidota bacterium]